MIEQNYLGRRCLYAKNCPVYLGQLVVERISTTLLRNVFCNRGFMGWKNCTRFNIAKAGLEIPAEATPYPNKGGIIQSKPKANHALD